MAERDFVLDYQRQQRLGFDEAIFCYNKTSDQINAIITDADSQQRRLLLTRLSEEKYAAASKRNFNLVWIMMRYHKQRFSVR